MRRHLIGLASLAWLAACGGNGPPVPPPVVVPPVERPTAEEIRAAGEQITEANTRQRLSVLADDSMGGRNTPSAGLEQTAQYLAARYQEWGLLPAGDNGGYIQRYPMVKTKLNLADSYLELREAGRVTRYTFERWGYPSAVSAPQPIAGGVKIIAGTVTTADIAPLELKGQVVLFVQDSTRAPINDLVVRALRAKGPVAIVNLRNSNAAMMPSQVATETAKIAVGLIGAPPATPPVLVITMHDSLWADAGTANRPDWNQLRRSTRPVIQDAPPEFTIGLVTRRDTVERFTAPNVVARIVGSDPLLKDEYVVFSSHMDHVGTVGDGVGGCNPKTRPDGSVDTICNGADDDGSGTTGVLSIAHAVASLSVKPKRSILILNVSGEEKGLLGSAYFAEHPTVPIGQIVADINIDMIGRNATDSIVVIGKEHSDLGATLARAQARHLELALTAADDIWPDESFYTRSDHFNFAKKGVPVLFFFNGTHPQYHQPDDEVKLIDFSKLARVAKLAFYFGIDLANTAAKPVWNPDSYRLIVVEGKTPVPVKRP